MSAKTPAARSRARRFVLQALYQMKMTGCSAVEVERQFREDYDLKRVDTSFMHEVLAGVTRERAPLAEMIDPLLDRDPSELDPIVRAALEIGAFELVHRIDIPWRVVINESVELAKQFASEDSHKFVNSVLDKLSETHRAVEREAR